MFQKLSQGAMKNLIASWEECYPKRIPIPTAKGIPRGYRELKGDLSNSPHIRVGSAPNGHSPQKITQETQRRVATQCYNSYNITLSQIRLEYKNRNTQAFFFSLPFVFKDLENLLVYTHTHTLTCTRTHRMLYFSCFFPIYILREYSHEQNMVDDKTCQLCECKRKKYS